MSSLVRWIKAKWPLVTKKSRDAALAQERQNAHLARVSQEKRFAERERMAQEIVARFAAVRVRFDGDSYQISLRFSPHILNYAGREEQNYVVDLMVRNIERELKSSVFVKRPEYFEDGSRGWRNDAARGAGL